MHRLNDAMLFLSSLQKFGIKLGLEQVNQLLVFAGNPEKDLRFIHVAGTNGKGSVCAMLDRALRTVNYNTGFYSSPHLISIFERFRVNGKAITENDFCDLIDLLRPEAEKMASVGRCPTFFEFTTAMAIVYFKKKKVDFVIWETGLGGRFDATNIVNPAIAVITSIALDHQEYLGTTIESIATEKAGIIKSKTPVFCNKLTKIAEEVMINQCITTDSILHTVPDYEFHEIKYEFDKSGFIQSFVYSQHQIKLSLAGKMQRTNFKLVFTVLEYLAQRYSFSLSHSLDGLQSVSWPGRIHFMPDGSIVDGGHNPDGAIALMESLNEIFAGDKYSIIFGSFKDKDSEEILSCLADSAAEFIFLPVSDGAGRQSRNGDELIKLLRKYSEVPARTANSIGEALTYSTKKRRLITGSLYLAGEAIAKFVSNEKILNI